MKPAGDPEAQPALDTNEVTPISTPSDSKANGPPESPWQVDVPLGVDTQMVLAVITFVP